MCADVSEMDMDPRDAWKYCMYKGHTFNKRDYGYLAVLINTK